MLSAHAAGAPDANAHEALAQATGLPLAGLLAGVLLFLAANIGLLVAGLGLIRAWRGRSLRQRETFRQRWEPVLFARMDGEAAPLPPLATGDTVEWLLLWLRVLSYVRGEAGESLAGVAREAGLAPRVLALLEARAAWKRLVAIRAAGAMRLAGAARPLRDMVYRGEARVALPALRALLDIDPQAGLEALERMLGAGRWAPDQVSALVRDAGVDLLPVLTRLLARASPGSARQLVRVIETLDDPAALPALRERLLRAQGKDGAGAAALLHALANFGDDEDRRAALALLGHRDWLVRMQAAYAIGRLGTARDIGSLLPLTRDAHWWVRYRAAQAIHALAAPAQFEALIRDCEDRYASEALERVRAEAGMDAP